MCALVDAEADSGEQCGAGLLFSLAPGETKSIVWRFTQPGTVELACHEAGHYEAGMISRVAVEKKWCLVGYLFMVERHRVEHNADHHGKSRHHC
jgi:hypothetical protein